ncbi:MAG: class I adenylate-forming enzyme family protein, partial [Verrucomicrobiia bacterium]
MTEPTVIAQFDAVAAAQPRKVCIFWGSDRIRNKDLVARIHAYGARLQAGYGVGRGDRVGILLKNCPEFIVALYAALKSGATVVPINSFLKAPEIQHIVDDCQLKCLITSGDFDETLARVRGITAAPLAELERGAAANPPHWPAVEPADL